MVTMMRRFGFLSLFSMLVLVFSTAAQAFTIDGNVFGVETTNGANPAIIENPDWTTPTDSIELSIPVDAFGGLWGSSFSVQWTTEMECGDDTVALTIPAPVPEPATSLLLGIGIAAIAASRRKLKIFI